MSYVPEVFKGKLKKKAFEDLLHEVVVLYYWVLSPLSRRLCLLSVPLKGPTTTVLQDPGIDT